MAVITIAREFGAGGKTLGTKVAEKMGYALIDEEIVGMIAEEANVSPDWVDSVAKETGSEGILPRILKKIGPYRKGYVGISMEKSPGYIDSDLYIYFLHKIIPIIASQDNVVIIGRGGQYILSDHPEAYHFLMLASMERRVTFMMDNYDLNRKQAEIIVDKQSQRRLNLYRYFGKTDYDSAKLYHMTFNMDRVELDDAVDNVIQLVSDS